MSMKEYHTLRFHAVSHPLLVKEILGYQDRARVCRRTRPARSEAHEAH